MPIDLSSLIDPAHTAVVTCEMQRGIVGDLAAMPELAGEVADRGVIDAARRLVVAARAAGVRVVHATVEMRADRAGLSVNNRIMAIVTKIPGQIEQGTPAVDLVPELGPEPADIVCSRIHGLTPFTGTELDAILRNAGVSTIVPVGVSVNEALLGLCLSAADLGYRLALPTDAVAGLPRAYAEDVIAHTLAMLATVTTVGDVVNAWPPGAA